NFQPRVGFAWDVFGRGNTVLRGGYAILTDQPITNLVTPLTANPPFGNPQAFNGTASNPLSRITYATLLTSGAAALSPTVVDPNFKNSYVESYNLNIQQHVSKNWSVMVGYFGSEAHHSRTRVNLNQFSAFGPGPTFTGIRPFPALSLSSAVRPGATL